MIDLSDPCNVIRYLKPFLSRQSCGSAARIAIRDHRKSEIFWELHCKCNSSLSFSLRSRGLT